MSRSSDRVRRTIDRIDRRDPTPRTTEAYNRMLARCRAPFDHSRMVGYGSAFVSYEFAERIAQMELMEYDERRMYLTLVQYQQLGDACYEPLPDDGDSDNDIDME